MEDFGYAVIAIIIGTIIVLPIAIPMIKSWKSDTTEKHRRLKAKEKKALEEELRQRATEIEYLKQNDPASYFCCELESNLRLFIFDDVLGDDYSCEADVHSILRDGILGVDCLLPNKDEVSRVKEVYYLKNGEERERLYSEKEFAKYYENQLYLLALKSIESIFELDDEMLLTGVLYNGIITIYCIY